MKIGSLDDKDRIEQAVMKLDLARRSVAIAWVELEALGVADAVRARLKEHAAKLEEKL